MGRTGRVAIGVVGTWAAALAVNRSLLRVRGRSMMPTLDEGDVLLTRPARRIRRGDVVVLRDPGDDDERRVKRVVGLAGEQLVLANGRLTIDGVRHVEPYATGVGPSVSVAVPDGHVVVLGDARAASTDSRRYGPVPSELVERVAVARVRPRPRALRAAPVALRLAGRPSAGAA